MAGQTADDRAQVALEEQRRGIAVVVALEARRVAAERRARELTFVLERTKQRVKAFGRRDLEIDVEVQPVSPPADLRARVGTSRRRTEVAVHEQLRNDDVVRAQERRRGRERTALIELASQLEQRTLRRVEMLR